MEAAECSAASERPAKSASLPVAEWDDNISSTTKRDCCWLALLCALADELSGEVSTGSDSERVMGLANSTVPWRPGRYRSRYRLHHRGRKGKIKSSSASTTGNFVFFLIASSRIATARNSS